MTLNDARKLVLMIMVAIIRTRSILLENISNNPNDPVLNKRVLEIIHKDLFPKDEFPEAYGLLQVAIKIYDKKESITPTDLMNLILLATRDNAVYSYIVINNILTEDQIYDPLVLIEDNFGLGWFTE